MRSIKARFNAEKRKNPYISDFINFGRAIKGQNFQEQAIRRNLHLAESDWENESKVTVLEHLLQLNRS